MKKYLEESGINKEARNVGFCLAKGTRIMPNFTIRDLRHHLRILSLDEVYLYLNYDTPYFHGRNALLSPNFEKEKDYGTYQLFGLHVKIDGIQHSKAEFYLPLKRDDGYFIFLMKLMKKIEVKYKFRCR